MSHLLVGQDDDGNLQEVKVTNNGLLTRSDPDFGGLSTDTKPTTGVRKFATFYEFDTGNVYIFDGVSTWWPT